MLTITLFGYPTLHQNHQPIDITRRKALALFLYLAMSRRPHSRDHLCTLLWSEMDTTTARAELRRMLSALKSQLGDYLQVDRDTVRLTRTDDITVDVWQFEQALNGGDWQMLAQHITLWTQPFLEGFSSGDAPQYDEWIRYTALQLQQQVVPVLEQLALQVFSQKQYADCIRYLQAWLAFDPDNERLHRWLMRCYALDGNAALALTHYDALSQRLYDEYAINLSAQTQALRTRIENGDSLQEQPFGGGVLPPMPAMVIGREDTLQDLKQRLGVGQSQLSHRLIVVQGLPGIGKTTLTAALAHDLRVQQHFQDGILWASLGQTPDLFAILMRWGQALGVDGLSHVRHVTEATDILSQALQDQQMLIIVDDIWDETHFTALNVGGRNSMVLVTTRLNRVAQALVTRQNDLYKIPILSDEQALDLLHTLAPDAVATYPDALRDLVHDLEGLPLALQVAGRLLREEHALGWGVHELLDSLRNDTRLLQAHAPLDRQSVDDVPQTVSALLALSTNTLDDQTRKRFALLGVFAPKPAIFELDAMQAVWGVEDARSTVRRLVERGLLDVVPGGEFQMHALLVQHARAMFGDNR